MDYQVCPTCSGPKEFFCPYNTISINSTPFHITLCYKCPSSSTFSFTRLILTTFVQNVHSNFHS